MKRRAFVTTTALTALSVSAFGGISWNGKRFEGDSVTTTDILGPYYRPGSPMRSLLIPEGSKGEPMNLTGTVFQKDGKTPLSNVLIEAWQCDENEVYDNSSDDYQFRGAVKTDSAGKYAFKTIVPVPYKDGGDWRPAHIHMRISSQDHQDLITQIYFKGDPHIAGDGSAGAPLSVNRILEIGKNVSNEKEVKFDVVMGQSFPLDEMSYKKITGLYQLEKGMAEFNKEDDLLIMKINGQYMEGMTYKGDNSFVGGLNFNRVKFEILADGSVKAKITMWDGWTTGVDTKEEFEGIKVLKYGA